MAVPGRAHQIRSALRVQSPSRSVTDNKTRRSEYTPRAAGKPANFRARCPRRHAAGMLVVESFARALSALSPRVVLPTDETAEVSA